MSPSVSWLVRISSALLGGLAIVSSVCRAASLDTVFHRDRLEAIEQSARTAIAAGRAPGAVIWLERNDLPWVSVTGHRAVRPSREAMTRDTIFDGASLTKVVATTTAVMILIERGKLRLDDPVAKHLPAFRGPGKQAITLRHLLTHHSGLRAGIPPGVASTGADAVVETACKLDPAGPPGKSYLYSDINFILLGRIVERVSGESLEVFCEQAIFKPLGMKDTRFHRFDPSQKPAALPQNVGRIAPTELQADGTILRGIVHDPTARRMGGVAGHAGLFLTVDDLARFCRMLLGGGRLGGARILKPESVAMMTSVQNPDGPSRRGLGWDIDSPHSGQRGAHFPRGGFGHTGWTGTSLWIDPFSSTFLIILTNRNHPVGGSSVLELRHQIATFAAEAVKGFNFLHVPGALEDSSLSASSQPATRPPKPVLNGIDVLVRDRFRQLDGLRVGLITNASGHDRLRRSSIDLLHEAPTVTLVRLFGPEHGIRGDLDQPEIKDSKDEATGLPVHSLYGERRSPTPEQLAGLDALVFDIQDVGCRFYTYLSTLTHCLEAASKAGLRLIVLDRVNPIGPLVEGPVLTEPRSFVGIHEIPLRHGMTLGELALMIRAERGFHVDLAVIACEGGNPVGWFDETGLPWSNPSPNLRSPAAALLYPGVGMLEFCKLSVGRGTDAPFELVGAPWIDEFTLAEKLNASGLQGIRFIPVRFTPVSSVFANQECRGVRLSVIRREGFRSVELGLLLASTLQTLHPGELNLDASLKLLGDKTTLEALKSGRSAAAIPVMYQAAVAGFDKRRKPFLLYPRLP